MTHCWEDYLTDEEKKILEKGKWGKTRGFGKKPVLLMIDLQYNYLGEDKPILEQQDKWPSGSGEVAWRGLERMISLREVARECNIPVIYTRQVQYDLGTFDNFAAKSGNTDRSKYMDGAPECQLVEELLPIGDNEIVMRKSYASAFIGTPLLNYLIKMNADTVIIVGDSTSGCCRATAVDAASYCYNVGFVEDCVVDRIILSHKAACLDVWMKYGDVVDSDYVKEYFRELVM